MSEDDRVAPDGDAVGSGPLWLGPYGVTAVTAAAVGLLLVSSARYGLHRDEFYFLAAGRRLDWGYVDQPPLVPLVARAADVIGGASPFALRLLPALAVGATVMLSVAIARRFGGGWVAQMFTACTVGGAGVLLAEGHLLSTAVFDFAMWTCALWIVVRIFGGADQRWWIALGVTVGIGFQVKHTIGLFALALAIAMLLTAQRRLLKERWPWIGAGVALAIALPNLLWQSANGWPQLEMAEALRARSDGPIAFIAFQPALLSVVLVIPAVAGLWWLFRAEATSPWRAIAIMYVLLVAFFMASGAKAYYIAPMYSALLAAGSLWFEQLTSRIRWLLSVWIAVGIAVGLFISLPLLPVDSASTLDLTGELGETVGWNELVEQVAAVHASIPAERRADTAILTGSYGEAGAIDLYGPELGLPSASSGHNSYWDWGPPEAHGPVIGVGPVADALGWICPGLEEVGAISNPHGVNNEASGLPLYLCLEPVRQLADVWTELRHVG